jgi:hypothetical protein
LLEQRSSQSALSQVSSALQLMVCNAEESSVVCQQQRILCAEWLMSQASMVDVSCHPAGASNRQVL